MAAPKTVATYDLNGSTREFDFAFDYLARSFVKVSLIGTERVVLQVGTDYTFVSANRIRTNVIYGAPDYQQIEIRRETSTTDRLVDFQDASILRADDLDLSQLQVLHVAEEAREAATETLGVNNFGHVDARGRRIVNVADPVDLGDVVTLRFYEGDVDGARAARTASEAARDKSREWATKMGSAVEGTEFSARHYASESAGQAILSAASATVANQHRANAELAKLKAQEWATKATAVEGTDQSAKTYAGQAAASASASADSASSSASQVSLAAAQVGLATDQANLSKDWATKGTTVADGLQSSRTYATQAQGHANAAEASKNQAVTQADRAQSEANRAETAAESVNGPYLNAQLANNTVAQSVHGGQLAGYRNVLHNGAMAVWQRGPGPFTPTHGVAACFADRWTVTRLGSGNFNIRMDTDAPSGQQLFESLTLQATGSHSLAAGDAVAISQGIEGYDARRLLGKTFTLSFWVKAARTGTYGVSFRSPTATKVYVLPYTITVANAWQKVVMTVPGGIPSDAAFNVWDNRKGVEVMWGINAGANFKTPSTGSWLSGNYVGPSNQSQGMIATSDVFKLTGVQLEIGAIATEFEQMTASTELARCQRYYQDYSSVFSLVSTSAAANTNAKILPVAMRASPVVLQSSTGGTGAQWTVTGGRVISQAGIHNAEAFTTLLTLSAEI